MVTHIDYSHHFPYHTNPSQPNPILTHPANQGESDPYYRQANGKQMVGESTETKTGGQTNGADDNNPPPLPPS